VRQLWIATLHISPVTRQKLLQRHRVDPEMLRARLVAVSWLRFSWHDHPTRGRRVVVDLPHGRRRLLVVLYPTDRSDTWHLASAYVVNQRPRWENRRRG
jgi:hypothetical protein